MKQSYSARARPSFLRRLWADFNVLCAAMDLTEFELMQLKQSRLVVEVADLRRASRTSDSRLVGSSH